MCQTKQKMTVKEFIKALRLFPSGAEIDKEIELEAAFNSTTKKWLIRIKRTEAPKKN